MLPVMCRLVCFINIIKYEFEDIVNRDVVVPLRVVLSFLYAVIECLLLRFKLENSVKVVTLCYMNSCTCA
jgi:hypothetical protein